MNKTRSILNTLIILISAFSTITQTAIYNRNSAPGRRVVVPRQFIGWYPMYDVSYTANFYVTSGRDDMNWGKTFGTQTNDLGKSVRRAYIEAIQDHECWTESGKDIPRDICVACGIGGCERWDFSDINGDGGLRNVSVHRHRIYWDDGTGNQPNTYRTEAVSTVAIIDRTNYFLTGGSEERSIVRFDIFKNATWKRYRNLRRVSTTNRTKEVVDIMIIKPTPYFVFTRTQEEYELGDYTQMTRIKTFGRNDANHRGGFGDYIDWRWDRNRVAISADYRNVVNVYDTALGAGTEYQRSHNTAGPVRAVAGIFDSPFFGVATLNQIQVFSTYENHATGVIVTFTETLSGPDKNIWDLKYIDSADYADNFDRAGRLITSQINTYRGPNEYDSRIEDQVMTNPNTGIPSAISVTERFFYTTKDQAKIIWWRDGTGSQCHPYCNDDCYLLFSHRHCRGLRCANKPNPIGNILPTNPPQAPGVYTRDTPNCLPQTEPNIANYHNGDPIIFDVKGSRSPSPRTAVPHTTIAPQAKPVITGELNGVGKQAPFVGVAHTPAAINTTTPGKNKPIRGLASEWWKWTMLGILAASLVGLLIGALALQQTPPIRRPIVREVVEEETVLVKKKPPVVKEEVVYKSVPRKTKVEKIVVEKKVSAKSKSVRSNIVKKRSYNPYKKKR